MGGWGRGVLVAGGGQCEVYTVQLAKPTPIPLAGLLLSDHHAPQKHWQAVTFEPCLRSQPPDLSSSALRSFCATCMVLVHCWYASGLEHGRPLSKSPLGTHFGLQKAHTITTSSRGLSSSMHQVFFDQSSTLLLLTGLRIRPAWVHPLIQSA